MKVKIGLCIAAALLLTGASVFEGSAKVISERELPETDYYVATNKFPNNTIVDIINIENGKTVRATVISGLETPSLLAAISRSTANAIGLPEQSTGRIRMIEASDSTRAPADFVFLTEPKMESVASPAPAFVTEPEWADDFYYEGDELPPVITPPHLAANTEIAG
ncbi:MAG: septal ring lytic transglycosylase RlpA family protein, partial [Treponema sp.]|nr:septal ring lytic transglycosylase RlpA family protein [Treponema sp.]